MTSGTACCGPRRPSPRPSFQRPLVSSGAAAASFRRRTEFGVAARLRPAEAARRKSLTGCAFVVEWPNSDRIVPIPLVHPDPAARAMLGSMLRPLTSEILEASDGGTAVGMLEQQPGLVLIGINPEDPEALGLFSHTRRKFPRLPT